MLVSLNKHITTWSLAIEIPAHRCEHLVERCGPTDSDSVSIECNNYEYGQDVIRNEGFR